MRYITLMLVFVFFYSCNNQKQNSNDEQNNVVTTDENEEKEIFTLRGTTWKTQNGGIIIFSEEEDKFLYGDEGNNQYSEGVYSKFGDKYSLKSADGELADFGFTSNFGSSPLIITIDQTNPLSFSFDRTDLIKDGGNFRRIKETITFTLAK